jgi:benzoyl-CoA reductase subunit D
MADRLVKLLKSTKAGDGVALLTGGLATDEGLLAAIREQVAERELAIDVVSHPDSVYAGGIGAALWGAFRHEKLARLEELASRGDVRPDKSGRRTEAMTGTTANE